MWWLNCYEDTLNMYYVPELSIYALAEMYIGAALVERSTCMVGD